MTTGDNQPNLNARQLAQRLGCSESHVYDMARLGQVPHFRAGARLVRFRVSEIEEWEKRGGTMPTNVPPVTAQPVPVTPDKAPPRTAPKASNFVQQACAPPPQKRKRTAG